MKIALVYDDLIQFGGGERLLMDVHKIWPHAPVFTSVASEKWLEICERENIDLKTSFMQKLPFVEKINRYYAPFLFHVLAFESFDFSEFDVVLSVSNRFAHGIITKPHTTHICYMNSPGRMFWEPHRYFKKEKLNKIAEKILGFLLGYIRMWDYAAAQRVDYFIANSKTPQERIKKYYKRKSLVINPAINTAAYAKLSSQKGEYFLVISRLVPWKRVDIAVDACSKANLPLKVIGDGPELSKLRENSAACVDFLGYVSEDVKKKVLSKCIAVINTQHEDFGLVPLEAMAMGKPVIAFGFGGALETVLPDETGEFFYQQSAEVLLKLLQNFAPDKYSTFACSNRARQFDISVFERKLRQYVNAVYLESKR